MHGVLKLRVMSTVRGNCTIAIIYLQYIYGELVIERQGGIKRDSLVALGTQRLYSQFLKNLKSYPRDGFWTINGNSSMMNAR